MAARRTVVSPFVVDAPRTLSAFVKHDASGIAKIPRLMSDSALRTRDTDWGTIRRETLGNGGFG
jgi:hypothetical protein